MSGQFVLGIDGAPVHEAENATPTTKSAMFTHVRGAYETKAPVKHASSLGHMMEIAASDTLEEGQKIISEATGQKVSSLVFVDQEDFNQDKPL